MAKQKGQAKILYLSRREIERMELTMAEIIDAVEKALGEKALDRTDMPPKHWISIGEDAFFSAMSSCIYSLSAAACKWQGGFPRNAERGLPSINGLLIISDMESGVPMAVMDSTWITAMRTPAATAVAAKYLARKDSETVAILGCGVQGRTNLEALLVVLSSLARVQAYDISERVLRKYSKEMTERFHISVIPASNPKEAVIGADIVITAAPILKTPKPVIEASWLKRGVFGVALDYDSYWKPEALGTMDKFCTDDATQLNHLKSFGHFLKTPSVYGEIGDIILGRKRGREFDEERIVCMSLGVAVEDLATAIRIYERAKKEGLGTELPL